MDQAKQLPVEVDNIKIEIPLALRGGIYSNTVSVTVTNNEVTINFIYVNPTDDPQGTLVSRVVISPEFADNLSTILKSTLEQHKKKAGEKK
jgi:hypothetical protein